MLIEHITVSGRTRKDLRSLDSLMTSIREVGLLQPVGVKSTGELIFGSRRLEAMRRLGFTSIPVTVLTSVHDVLNELQAEMDENMEREPFTAVDAAALRRRMKELRLPLSVEIQRQHLSENRDPSGQFGTVREVATESVVEQKPSTDHQVTAVTGYSVTTLQRVDRIAEFVHAEDPAISLAATAALARIGMGAPVKPLLDSLINAQAVARATEKYPALEHARADTKHVVRMETYLDGIAASGDTEALQEELDALSPVNADDENTVGPTAAQRELGFEVHVALAASIEKYNRADGTALLTSLLPSLTKATFQSWILIADDMERTSAAIKAALHHESES